MSKIAIMTLLALAFASSLHPQNWESRKDYCVDLCMREEVTQDLQKQEVTTLERELARAVEHNDGTFIRRVYSDDFSGTLSRGQSVDKAAFINVVQTTETKYESVRASNINVNIYRETAVATSLWSIRSFSDGQRISSQLRVIHVYFRSQAGYRIVASQSTPLPPYTQQPL